MKRALTGLAVAILTALATVLTALATAGSASAAPQQVSHYHFNGNFAEALLSSSTPTSDTSTYIRVSQSAHASSLVAEQFTQNYDAQHNLTGATDTLTEATSGFSFSIDTTKLSAASVAGPALPATTCTYDANFTLVSCSPGTLSLDATWTGQGPITHSTSSSHVRAGGFSVTDHLNGTSRDATTIGSIDGSTLGASQYAVLGKAVSGSTTLCIGNYC